MATTPTPALAIATLFFAVASSQFPSKSAADSSEECPYPCLPPPTSVTDCPPPPPTPSEPSPPPPPQPYTPGYYSPPSPWGPGNVPYNPPPPSLVYPAPPPPNPIMPYFPYYYRSSSGALLRRCSLGLGLPMAFLHLILLGFFLS